jgi:hypothetical protein
MKGTPVRKLVNFEVEKYCSAFSYIVFLKSVLWIRNDLVRLDQDPAFQVFSDPFLPYSLNQAN